MAFNGQFIHTASDFTLKGAGIDFNFRRTYMNQSSYNGPLGSNWDHDYNLWIRISEQEIYRSTGTMREDVYIRHPNMDKMALIIGCLQMDRMVLLLRADNITFTERQQVYNISTSCSKILFLMFTESYQF